MNDETCTCYEDGFRRWCPAHGDGPAVPGPPTPPYVPGHLGNPSYEESAKMVFTILLYDALGARMPPSLTWQIGPYERRLRLWVHRENKRDGLAKLLECVGR